MSYVLKEQKQLQQNHHPHDRDNTYDSSNSSSIDNNAKMISIHFSVGSKSLIVHTVPLIVNPNSMLMTQ